MGFIYKITNDINDKVYIGQTINNIQYRFRSHINQALREPKDKFHYALKEIGIEHFSINKIEECANELLDEREKYWIKYYNSVEKGYNTTWGGSVGFHYDRAQILQLWNQGYIIQEISDKIGVDRGLLGQILTNEGITKEEINQRRYEATKIQKTNRKIYQIDPNTGEIIRLWNRINDVERELGINHASIIGCCQKQKNKKTCGGFTWRYIEDYNPNTDAQQLVQHTINDIFKNTKHILKYNTKNELLKEYESAQIAAKEENKNAANIRRYCRGERKDPNGFIWKYKE